MVKSSRGDSMLRSAQFVDRYDAGRQLGVGLRAYADGRPLVVLGLPRGGVPVAACVAEELDAPLDIFVVRKLGVPGHVELALGAIASGGARVLNRGIIDKLEIPAQAIERVTVEERRELERRERSYRAGEPFRMVAGKTVIVVDDGAATGASMLVAVDALRELGPRSIVAAIPVASREAFTLLASAADWCECLAQPEPFYGVGLWYRDFTETSDAEVRTLLAAARRRLHAAASIHSQAETRP